MAKCNNGVSKGGWVVKNLEKSRYVICERPPIVIEFLFASFVGTFSMWLAALTSGEYMTEHGVILPTHFFTES